MGSRSSPRGSSPQSSSPPAPLRPLAGSPAVGRPALAARWLSRLITADWAAADWAWPGSEPVPDRGCWPPAGCCACSAAAAAAAASVACVAVVRPSRQLQARDCEIRSKVSMRNKIAFTQGRGVFGCCKARPRVPAHLCSPQQVPVALRVSFPARLLTQGDQVPQRLNIAWVGSHDALIPAAWHPWQQQQPGSSQGG